MTTQSTAPGLPDAAAVELVADPLAVAIVRKACAGYWLVTRCETAGKARDLRYSINEALGVTNQQREAMLAGSIFGWDCPAANPNNYDEAGNVCPVRDCPHDDTSTRGASRTG